jgi:ABC-type antimicrobial peptide transport system permease subunit
MDRDVAEIVGIAMDAQVSRIGSTESSYLYLPATASPERRRLNVLVRSDTGFEMLAASIRRGMGLLDDSLVAQIQPLRANLEIWRTGSRAVAILSGSVSVLAVLLASIGVYGVVSYLVTRRRREVGIRMTLGATPQALQGLILRETLRPVCAGLLIGLVGAAATSQVLESSLFGISPFDPIAFFAAGMFLLAVASVATLVPVREALKLDPMTALRHD